jgi:hypothetical protein
VQHQPRRRRAHRHLKGELLSFNMPVLCTKVPPQVKNVPSSEQLCHPINKWAPTCKQMFHLSSNMHPVNKHAALSSNVPPYDPKPFYVRAFQAQTGH